MFYRVNFRDDPIFFSCIFRPFVPMRKRILSPFGGGGGGGGGVLFFFFFFFFLVGLGGGGGVFL